MGWKIGSMLYAARVASSAPARGLARVALFLPVIILGGLACRGSDPVEEGSARPETAQSPATPEESAPPPPSEPAPPAEPPGNGAGSEAWFYAAEIHPDLPEVTFVLLGDSPESAGAEGTRTTVIESIEIRREGKSEPFQILTGLDAEPPLESEAGFQVLDMNFDGYRDFRMIELLPAGPNVPYLNWLYDPEIGSFVRAAVLDALTSPSFDPETRRVSSSWREDAATHSIEIYEFAGEQLVTVRRETRKYTEPGRFRLTVHQRIDGELRTTGNRMVEEEPE